MVEWHTKSKRKPSGGMRTSIRKMDKKLYQRGGVFAATTIAPTEKEVKVETRRIRGGKLLSRVLKAHTANVFDGKKAFKAKIIAVALNEANRLYTRRNIITKGSIIKIHADSGEKLAKVTSRPGQDGAVNAVIWHGKLKTDKEETVQKKNPQESKHEEKHKEAEKKAHKEHKVKEK